MERTILTALQLRKSNPTVYTSDYVTVPAAPIRTSFPILSYLASVLKPEDRVKIILIEKIEAHGEKQIKTNEQEFFKDMAAINEPIGAEVEYEIIQSPSEMSPAIHRKLIKSILDKVEVGSHLTCDMTYGTKDVPIVELSALAAAEKLLGCVVDKIIYGQGTFDNETNQFLGGVLCDMSPLYALVNLVNRLESDEPAKGRQIIDLLLK